MFKLINLFELLLPNLSRAWWLYLMSKTRKKLVQTHQTGQVNIISRYRINIKFPDKPLWYLQVYLFHFMQGGMEFSEIDNIILVIIGQDAANFKGILCFCAILVSLFCQFLLVIMSQDLWPLFGQNRVCLWPISTSTPLALCPHSH